MIGEEFYASQNLQSTTPGSTLNESNVSNENPVTRKSGTYQYKCVNGKHSLTLKPNSTSAITEVVKFQKTASDLSETLARYQAKFGPIPTILTGKNFTYTIL